jgi:sulfite reductase (ferredoxin)
LTPPKRDDMADATPVKETKAQRAERLKREKNPWEAFDEVRAFARQGRSSVLPEWASLYFKWWGIYTQGDGAGATGGKGGEGLASDYFMMRIAIPNGVLSSAQMRVIAELTRSHARNLADITVRQAIQLHWLSIESLPEVVDALSAIGLSPKGACGDVVRNVTGCPLAGVAADEIIDSAPLAREIAALLGGNAEFYNLPRKFKISVTGCPSWCSVPEINDVGLTAVKHNGQVGYSLRVGGGLSREPHIAVKLDAFILPDQVHAVVRGVAEIFREQQGLRESRERARLKYLFLKEGWTAESFLAELQSRLDFKLLPAVPEHVPDDILRDHVGITAQRQPGLSSVGATVLRGRLSGDQLLAAAELSERFGSSSLRTTTTQNLIFIDIPNAKVPQLIDELGKIGLRVEGSPFWRGAIACTGTEFCKLAITETNGWSTSSTSACPVSINSSSSTSPAAPTAAASIGSPTSVSRAKKSSRTALLSMPTTSALAAQWVSMRPSRGPSVSVVLRRWCRRRSSACCASTSPTEARVKTCAHGSAAIPTKCCAAISPASRSLLSIAICPAAPYRTASPSEVKI